MATLKKESKGTKFIWKIENYDCIKEKFLVSPSFISNILLWNIKVFPNGEYSTANCISLHLNCLDNRGSHWPRYFKCSISFLDSEGSSLIWKESKTIGEFNAPIRFSFTNFMKHQEIFGLRKSSFLLLPNNVLTILCCIWESQAELLLSVPDIVTTHIEPRHAEVVGTSFILKFEKVTSYEKTQTLKHVQKMTKSSVSLAVEGYWTEDQLKARITLSSNKFIVSFSISLFDSNGRDFLYTTGTHHFKTISEVWDFDTYITQAMLMCNKSRFLHGDTLLLKFKCMLLDELASSEEIDDFFTVGKNKSTLALYAGESENVLLNRFLSCSNAISQDLNGMYEEGFMSDCSLKVGEKTFPVHRAILGARSPVFRSMFTTEMKEKHSDCVEIKDVDAVTLQRMLQYFYSDKLDKDMGWKGAYNLYVTGDKYNIKTLKQGCSALLMTVLCNEGALDILSLANLHKDLDLKSATLDFISRNDKEIVGTEHWVRFEEENTLLAHDTIMKLYIKKMNG